MESLGAMFPAAWPTARGSVLVAALLVVAVVPGCIEGQPPFFTAEFPPRSPHPEHDVAPTIDRTYSPSNDPRDGSPYGVHLSWREDPRTTMTVTWFTRGQTNVRPAVLWGPHPEDLDRYVPGESRQVFGVNAQAHEVTIQGLEPAQLFYYRAIGTTGESATYATRTAPEHGRDGGHAGGAAGVLGPRG
jgi:acid phosphatase type 7